MFSSALQHLPTHIWQHFLFAMAAQNLLVQRRLSILGILWNESGLTKPALQARVEALLGPGCFGKQPTLAFARDIRFLRQALLTAGLHLKYHRTREHPGYWIAGRPALERSLKQKMSAALSEVSPEQADIFARLTPAERVWQGATLSDQLRSQAVRRLQQEQPNLGEAEAHREVLRRMYRVER